MMRTLPWGSRGVSALRCARICGAVALVGALAQGNAGAVSVGDVYQLEFQPQSPSIQFGPTAGAGSFTISGVLADGIYTVADLSTAFDYRYTRFDTALNTTVVLTTSVSYTSSSYYPPSGLRLTYDAGQNLLRVFNVAMNAFNTEFSLRATGQAPFAYMSDDYYSDLTIGNSVTATKYTFVNGSALPSFPAAIVGNYTVLAPPVPEPAAYAMLLAGLALVGMSVSRTTARRGVRRLTAAL